MPNPRSTTFILTHLLWPMLGFTLLVILLALTNADNLIAEQIYQLSGGSWRLRDAWVTSVLLHDGGRKLIGVAAVMLMLSTLASVWVQSLKVHRRALSYLLVSALISGLIVNLLKQFTHVECPWDLVRYGGAYDYAGIFSRHSFASHNGACFPAGHASAAYSWFGLYFIARTYRPHLQRYALGGVALLGMAFGIAQQLRGAHFISHDVWTIAICWLVATLAYMVFFRQISKTPGSSSEDP